MEKTNLFAQAYNHKFLTKIIYDLSLNIFTEKFASVAKNHISEEDIRKAVWLASVLSESTEELHQRKAQLFSSLLFLQFQDRKDIAQICYILFSRLGNLTATKFLENLYENEASNPVNLISKYEFNDILTFELLEQRERHIINTSNNSFLVTRFQKKLWNALHNQKYVAISAPTSSGKSFVLKQYLIDHLHSSTSFRALYIVPSRALINQVSEEFHLEINPDTTIKTSFVEDAEIKDKELYILTPERCIKLLSSTLKFDFIFTDEIQGVEDTSGRGLIFEYVFNQLPYAFPLANIVTAGPNINAPEKTFLEIFEHPAQAISTSVSPVFQLKVIMRPTDGYKFDIEIKAENKRSQKFTENFGFTAGAFATEGTAVAHIVKKLASSDINIIFTKTGSLAQNWALKYSAIVDEQEEIEPEVKELITFLKEDIHSKYYLVQCLQKKVAYHHGSLPDLVRKEIEELFANEKLKSVFCTSTLLEGVNLPANNLFTLQPMKDKDPLTKFEFGNLIGRAGRLNSSLYGTIYYIERITDQVKSEEYFDSEYNKEIQTFSTNAIDYLDIDSLRLSVNEMDSISEEKSSKAKQINIFLKHKFIQSAEKALKYLTKKNLDEAEIARTLLILKNTVESLTVPKKVLVNNPSIDPLLQDKLYKAVISGDIREWVINKNHNFSEYLAFGEADNTPHHLKPFYLQFVSLVEKLDSIFQIVEECKDKYHRWVSPKSMCLQAKRWLYGDPIGKIISSDIAYLESKSRIDSDKIEDINKVINETIKYNSTVTTHLLPKYIKILIDVLETVLTDAQKEEYKLTLSLATMLELGTQEPSVIKLISAGISRNVALQIYEKYKDNVPKSARDVTDILDWLNAQQDIKGLKPIYNRYLRRLKFLAP